MLSLWSLIFAFIKNATKGGTLRLKNKGIAFSDIFWSGSNWASYAVFVKTSGAHFAWPSYAAVQMNFKSVCILVLWILASGWLLLIIWRLTNLRPRFARTSARAGELTNQNTTGRNKVTYLGPCFCIAYLTFIIWKYFWCKFQWYILAECLLHDSYLHNWQISHIPSHWPWSLHL